MPHRAVQPHTTRLATYLSLLLVVAVLIPYLGSATLALGVHIPARSKHSHNYYNSPRHSPPRR